jgi:hypothetical protein
MKKLLPAALAALCVAWASQLLAQPIAYTATTPEGARITVNGIQADNGNPISISSATTTVVVTGIAGLRTFITHDTWASNGAGTVKWVYGHGTNCGTGTTAITGAIDVVAQFAVSEGIGLGPVHKPTPVGEDTCIVTTGSATAKGDLAFSQQP